MAKQKSKTAVNSKDTKRKEATAAEPIRVRTSEEKLGLVRGQALKTGPATVTTVSVGPNTYVTIVVFDRPKDTKQFRKWVETKDSSWIVDDASELEEACG